MKISELAKRAVETYVRERREIYPSDDLEERYLRERTGTFVTIEKKGELRACIGTYLPTKENIAKEVISNAIAAASRDFRFGTIVKDELPILSYTVCLLGKPEPIKNVEELNPQKYGIIVRNTSLENCDECSPNKSALLLPGIKGIKNVKEQILIACQKGGIDPSREKVIIYRFTAEKHK